MSAVTMALLREQTARACALARRLELATLPHQPRYASVVLAQHQLERAAHFLASPTADDEEVVCGPVSGCPRAARGLPKMLRWGEERPMDVEEKSGPSAGCHRADGPTEEDEMSTPPRMPTVARSEIAFGRLSSLQVQVDRLAKRLVEEGEAFTMSKREALVVLGWLAVAVHVLREEDLSISPEERELLARAVIHYTAGGR
jgi:hypothetical protein